MNDSDQDLKTCEEAKRLRMWPQQQRWELMKQALNDAESQPAARKRLTPAARIAEQTRKLREWQAWQATSLEPRTQQDNDS